MTAYLRDNVWGLNLTVVRLLGKLQGLRPDSERFPVHVCFILACRAET